MYPNFVSETRALSVNKQQTMRRYEAALRGSFLGGSSDEEDELLYAAMAFAAGIVASPPRAPHEAPVTTALALTALQMVRTSVIGFRVADAEPWIRFIREAKVSADSCARCASHIGDVWLRLAGIGNSLEGAFNTLEEVEAAARGEGFAEMVVEAAALQALVLMRSSLADATRIARRASRMSRTEAMPQLEYLSNLVLTAIRRQTGQPHLAARIGAALHRVAPPAWRSWLGWELFLAGTPVSASPDDAWTAPLLAWMRAMAEPDFGAVESPVAALRRQVEPYSAFAWQLETLIEASCVEVATENSWLSGATDAIPGVLCGVARLRENSPSNEVALAYVHAGRTARRVLPLGHRRALQPDVVMLEQGHRKQARMASLVSTLALAGPAGLPDAACFERLYGFPYEADVHHGVFNVLLHRTRKYAESVGVIERRDGLLSLRLSRPVLVPDPRCTPPAHDRVLQAIAQQTEPVSAKHASSSAGVSLRMAQMALKELVEDGVCVVAKSGRESRYHVEDTTFSEPTLHN